MRVLVRKWQKSAKNTSRNVESREDEKRVLQADENDQLVLDAHATKLDNLRR